LSAFPKVTVQLPVYNERYVIDRLIDAAAALDYPHDCLQIQVLDDSDDATTTLALRAAQRWQQRGVRVDVVRRADRSGYKAGALAHGLRTAQGEFIAIFDADFVPPRSFLHNTVPHFLGSCNAHVGFVQTRWAHLNLDYSWLTRCQALALDGHFLVEQGARAAAGYPFGFNGSAGIWRRACIEHPAVGGWQSDTLCEDLDLSYRAQLAGWSGRYLADVAAPGEIPVQLLAFKRQQYRWAKGSVQTLVKLGPRILRHGWRPVLRALALAHLGNYLIHPLLLILLLVALPMLLLDIDPAAPLAYLSLFSLGPPLLYALAQRRLHPGTWLRRWMRLPILMALGTGLALNNTVAVVQGVTGRGGAFLRTPKFQVREAADRWQTSAYRLSLGPVVMAEYGLALYALVAVGVALARGNWGALPFLTVYAAGFGLMGVAQTVQAMQARAVQRHSQVVEPRLDPAKLEIEREAVHL
jgi:cellulose synthase/poly-beta-1,6-N-acetylglucosamine synthase-like glycosyltransferase